MSNVQLSWVKCQGEIWCPLSTVNLDHPAFDNVSGVYIIWHAGSQPATVYVGEGVVRDRLKFHRTDPRIQQFFSLGLYVTYASAPDVYLGGILSYIMERFQPKVRESDLPLASPIGVNLPW